MSCKLLKDRPHDGCRWPVGETSDGRHLFCAEPIADNLSRRPARRCIGKNGVRWRWLSEGDATSLQF
jgi:hypothetical protein